MQESLVRQGKVTGFQDGFYRVEDRFGEVLFLTSREVYPGIQVGDQVRLEWLASPSRGYWRATTCLER